MFFEVSLSMAALYIASARGTSVHALLGVEGCAALSDGDLRWVNLGWVRI